MTQVVLGSMERVEEYQQVLISLKEKSGGEVRGEMIDRILDGGELAFSYAVQSIKRSLCEVQDWDRNVTFGDRTPRKVCC